MEILSAFAFLLAVALVSGIVAGIALHYWTSDKPFWSSWF